MRAQCRPHGSSRPGGTGHSRGRHPTASRILPTFGYPPFPPRPRRAGGSLSPETGWQPAGPVASAKGLRAHLGPRRGKAASPLSPQMQILGALPFRERLPLPPSPVINYPTETWHGNPIPPVGNEGMKGQSWLRKDRPPLPCPGLPSRPCLSALSHLVQCRWWWRAGHGAPAGARAATSL